MIALRNWYVSLRESPVVMTRRERVGCVLAIVSAALSRLLAVAASPWDWDEMLFMLSLRDYDVAAHHPHPPGFPLFIASAKLLHALGLTEFRSLQFITVAGAMLLAPAMILLVRELRLPASTAIVAALLLAFLPNVWFYGGTALSDVPSLTLSVAAAGLLLRGIRSRPALFAGAVTAGCAIGVRPQNVLVLALPFLVVMLHRRAAAAGAVALAVAIAIGAYAGAAAATGSSYREAIAVHQRYITATDSFLSPSRPSLVAVFDDFFFRPYRQPLLNIALAVLAVAGVVTGALRRHVGVAFVFATFAPFCVFAWLFLDYNSTSRFSIGYMPLYAILAAEGLALAGSRVALSAAVVIAGGTFAWLAPGLREVRTVDSPPVAAFSSIAQARRPKDTVLYVEKALAPYAAALAPQFPVLLWNRNSVPASVAEEPAALLVREGSTQSGRVFSRNHGALWNVARKRYYDVSVVPMRARVAFGSGWYGQEGHGLDARRWMAPRSSMTLPDIGSEGRLAIGLLAPAAGQAIDVFIDGTLRGHVAHADGYVDREYAVTGAGTHEVLIVTDRRAASRGDDRLLGLRLEWLEWSSR